jgi:hypothetical protein
LVPSLATTVWGLAVEAGTVNVTPENDPEVSVVTVAGLVVSGTPSYVNVTVWEAIRPEPDIVTVVPTGPNVGDNVSDDVTVNVADAMLLKLSTATTVCEPAVEAGTVNVTPENDPKVSGVTVATVVPSYLIVTLLAGRRSNDSLTL